MKHIFKIFALIGLIVVGVSCKKKEEATPVRDKLIGKWQGETATPSVSAFGIDLSEVNQPFKIDSVTIDLMADNTFSSSTTNSQTVNGTWSLQSNDTQIKLDGFTFTLPNIGNFPLTGVKIPDTYTLQEVTDSRLVLKATISQSITLPTIPLPITVSGDLELVFNKQ
ncbi:hypothetical protein [uncultured Microscilla sp.]|uniref:hypothetical protein n=1 Tax=uncultured Microscilla sp. TaxID=432653 RepID=UPI002604B866|nr:hypothetical protein [uncultured Microscilla sp.]